MRANNWLNGAQLMEEWFAGAVRIKPNYGAPGVSTIKMDSWVLTFARAKTVYDAMLRDKVWSNDKARERWADVLQGIGL